MPLGVHQRHLRPPSLQSPLFVVHLTADRLGSFCLWRLCRSHPRLILSFPTVLRARARSRPEAGQCLSDRHSPHVTCSLPECTRQCGARAMGQSNGVLPGYPANRPQLGSQKIMFGYQAAGKKKSLTTKGERRPWKWRWNRDKQGLLKPLSLFFFKEKVILSIWLLWLHACVYTIAYVVPVKEGVRSPGTVILDSCE